jgi:plastocyanin
VLHFPIALSPEVQQVRTVVALTLLATLSAPALAGTIRGRVELVEKSGRKAADLSEVVVYLDGIKSKPQPAKATIVMKGKSFNPHVVVVPIGGVVEFPNEDPIFHNVFSVSGENRFDLDLYKRPKSGQWTFKTPGVARVYCNIHPQMSAVVLVRDSPFFTKAAADGSYVLADVPAGRYTLKAWHERAAGEASLEVAVSSTGETAGPLSLDASGYKRVAHKNKFGRDYSSDEKY